MRTRLILDEALIERAQALTGLKTRRAILEAALRTLSLSREQTEDHQSRFEEQHPYRVFLKSRFLILCHCETGVLGRSKQSLPHFWRLLRQRTPRNDSSL
ncbi:MAG: type II toxin-antitoxin system VapB family antitoxin [Anaerolineales bacterium]